MPKMLTVDEQFEAIVDGAVTTARLDPFQEPVPKESVPAEQDDEPEEKEEK
ncbi:hypothetical protein ACWFMI_25980 [Nocardiopsis terrae]